MGPLRVCACVHACAPKHYCCTLLWTLSKQVRDGTLTTFIGSHGPRRGRTATD